MKAYITQEERLNFIIKYLCNEEHGKNYAKHFAPTALEKMTLEQKQSFFRALVNTRIPAPIGEDFLSVQDAYLQEEAKIRGIAISDNFERIQENISIWQGDITLIEIDAIVNAANSELLGCFIPSHACIDNFIHTFAGVQLRQDCYEIIQKQGHSEKTGLAKITSAYNLPSKYILHTVGPIISSDLTEKDCELLASCYTNCLELAQENGLKSIAFCCISTGVFRFPNEKAAEIAIATVKKFQEETKSNMHIVFNVFKDIDYDIYKKLLSN